MTAAEMLDVLRAWQAAMQAAETQVDALQEMMGINPEAPLFDALCRLMGLATRQAADLIGAPADWLEAWWLEHQLGATPMQAGLRDEPLRALASIEDLAAIIADDQKGAQ